ncbi:hypothetical protein EMPG_13761, partial [Blastomyces silverae]
RQLARPTIPPAAIPERSPPDRIRWRQPSRQLLARTSRFHHLRHRCSWRGQDPQEGRARYNGE